MKFYERKNSTFSFFGWFYRYTDSVMNYQSMAPSASSFAQFYHQAAVSAASAGVVGGVGDSLGKWLFVVLEFQRTKILFVDKKYIIRIVYFYIHGIFAGNCTQPSSGVASTAGSTPALSDLPRYPWMALTGGNYTVSTAFFASFFPTI